MCSSARLDKILSKCFYPVWISADGDVADFHLECVHLNIFTSVHITIMTTISFASKTLFVILYSNSNVLFFFWENTFTHNFHTFVIGIFPKNIMDSLAHFSSGLASAFQDLTLICLDNKSFAKSLCLWRCFVWFANLSNFLPHFSEADHLILQRLEQAPDNTNRSFFVISF